jgi:parallel beta-helix repeat protein
MGEKRDSMCKKLLSIGSCFLFVISMFSGLMLIMNFSGCVSADVLYVGGVGPGNYSSIQLAIDAADVGDSVFVFGGTYLEKVTISKAITLEGEDRSTTIMDGSGSGNVVRIESTDYVEIRSLTLKNADNGVNVDNSENIKIEEVNISLCTSDGILVERSNYVEITDCTILGLGAGSGIEADHSDYLEVESNYIERFANGIYSYYSYDPLISHNTINSNADGIEIFEFTGAKIVGNTLWNSSDSGLKVDKSNFIMESTEIDLSGFGVHLSLKDDAYIYNSTITASSQYDLHVGRETLTLVNVSFDYENVNISDLDGIVIVKNYLEVYVQNSDGDPVADADVIVTNNDQDIYDSNEDDDKTNANGLVSFIESVYAFYQYDMVQDYKINEGTTSIEAFFGSYDLLYLGDDPQDIDMSSSHRETFQLDTQAPTISGVTSWGNISLLQNTFDRSLDDFLAISFTTSETGSYTIVINTSGDFEFLQQNDTVLVGSATGNLQTVFWDGTNETQTFADGIYYIQISLVDEYDNVIQNPYHGLIVKIQNTDSDGDGVVDFNDDFPLDATQTSDNDGDGYGDNPNGSNADAFPTNPTQWKDSDGDGYGDNPDGSSADAFPEEETQWLDSDSDGHGDNLSGKKGDAFPQDPTQWKDSDGDGYGDNASGENPDAFPTNRNEWSDRDKDGYGDRSDEFPDDPKEWEDTDGDGVGDNSDLIPTFNELILFFIIGIIVVVVIAAVVGVKKRKVAARPFETQLKAAAATPVARTPPPKARKLPPPPKRRAPKKAPEEKEKLAPKKKKKLRKVQPPGPPAAPEAEMVGVSEPSSDAAPEKAKEEPPPPPPQKKEQPPPPEPEKETPPPPPKKEEKEEDE